MRISLLRGKAAAWLFQALKVVLFQEFAHFAPGVAVGEGFVVSGSVIFAAVARGCITEGMGIL
jgi:hypothetical protein